MVAATLFPLSLYLLSLNIPMKYLILLTPIFLLFSPLHSLAQTGTVKGFVYNEETGEPMIFTNVYLMGTTHGTSTDDNGYYTISKIPYGNYKLLATSIGYDSAIVEIELSANRSIISKQLYIKESAIQLEGVEISAESQENKTQVKMSVVKLTPKQIQKMPSIGGEPDLAQYLQVLPGVVFTGDQGGQLYIRGGSPIQNLVLLDGMTVYNPFHSIGLFSVFDTDILKTADVYTGGFGAEYGGRISSVMDIKTRDGNRQRATGNISATTFGAGALIEGPLGNSDRLGGSQTSFILSAKHSYLKNSSELFYPNVGEEGLPYSFIDIFGKFSINGSNGNKVSFFGFNNRDKVDYQKIAGFEWVANGFGTNFVLVPGQTSTLIEGNIAYSDYDIAVNEPEGSTAVSERNSSINGFNFDLGFTKFNGDNEMKYGFAISGYKTDFSYFNAFRVKVEQVENTTEIAAYVAYTWNVGKFVLEPGFRLQYYASLSEASPEPRLAMKYNVSDRFRLKAAAGLYSQNLVSATSDRDVVNLFYGFLSSPTSVPDQFTEQDGDVRDIGMALQKAEHAIFGFEYDLGNTININVEAYYKKFSQLTNINRNKKFDDTPEYANEPGRLKKSFIIETGDAYGIDFVLKYDNNDWSIWGVYSLGKVDRWNGDFAYSPIFDRRHNVNIVASYMFGKNDSWAVDARWNYGSGFPFTQPTGFFENITFQDGITTDYVSMNGELSLRYGALNGGRLPDYHRMDLSIKKNFIISEHSNLQATFSVTNVYDRDNIFYVNRITNERINQLPVLPSFGLKYTF